MTVLFSCVFYRFGLYDIIRGRAVKYQANLRT